MIMVRIISDHLTRDIDVLPYRYKCSNQMVAVSRSGNVRHGVLKHSIIVSTDGSSLTPSLERSRRRASEACLKPSFSHTGDKNTCRYMSVTSRVRNYTLRYLVRKGK